MNKNFSIKKILFVLWIIGLIFYTGIPYDKTHIIPYIKTEIIFIIIILSFIVYFKKTNKRLIILLIILLLVSQIFTYLFIKGMKIQNNEIQIKKNIPQVKIIKNELLQKEKISNIKKEYLIIQENLDKYKKYEKDAFGKSTEGGVVIYYLDNENIIKIRTQFYGEMGQTISEYYYKNNNLIFVFTQNYSYNRPIYYDETMAQKNNDEQFFDIDKSIINENKYYYNNKKLIEYIDENNNKVELGNDLFLEKESYILTKSQELINDF